MQIAPGRWRGTRTGVAIAAALIAVCAVLASDRFATATPAVVVAASADLPPAEIPQAAIEAVRLAASGKHAQAAARAAQVDDPALQTLVRWYSVRSSNGTEGFDEIAAFMAAHGDWPLIETIAARAERAAYLTPPDPAQAVRHFRAFPPSGGLGKVAYARALRDTGDNDAALEAIRDAWRNHDYGERTDNKILSEFEDLLTEADHRARLVRQIYAHETTHALRTAAMISSDHVKMVRAADALFRRHSSALSRYNAVPARLRNQSVMQYALANYYRRRDLYKEAREVLLQVPAGQDALSYPDAWWSERLTLARSALRRDTPELWDAAYRITRAHGFAEGTLFVQGEFMSGWIALQFLEDAEKAIPHFKLILERDQKALNISQAHYWLGRAYNALGNMDLAEEHFSAAAAWPTTFYGQLALDALGRGTEPLALPEPPEVSEATAASVAEKELVRAIRLLAAADQTSQFNTFFGAAVHSLDSTEQRVALVRLAMALDATPVALRTAKMSARLGDDLGHYAFPRDVLPDYRDPPLHEVEDALIHGVIRQESEFNASAISHAGARGLMQIMPGTAKMIARQHGFSYSRANLTRRPSYNLELGTRHLGDLLEQFNGSYIMTIAAYNAGGGRIPQWIERSGDPRKGEVEPVDWIESIPFNETRNYVKRVLENVQVYRTLFGATPLVPLGRDLSRGGEVMMDTAGPINCDAVAQSSIEQLIACN